MTITIEEFNRLKSQVEKLQRKADKAEGALEQTMALLNTEFNCDSIEEAQEKAEEYSKEADKLKAKFEESHEAFNDKWEDVLA